MKEQDIQDLAESLRFNSPNDRLTLESADRVDGKQIQSIRELISSSGELLQERLAKRSDASRNPPWTRDEVVLALDTYFQRSPSHMSQSDPVGHRPEQDLNRIGWTTRQLIATEVPKPKRRLHEALQLSSS